LTSVVDAGSGGTTAFGCGDEQPKARNQRVAKAPAMTAPAVNCCGRCRLSCWWLMALVGDSWRVVSADRSDGNRSRRSMAIDLGRLGNGRGVVGCDHSLFSRGGRALGGCGGMSA
jgi:hypothetical protein